MPLFPPGSRGEMARGLPGVCAISLNPSADSEKIGDGIVGFQHRLNFSTEPLPWFQRWNYSYRRLWISRAVKGSLSAWRPCFQKDIIPTQGKYRRAAASRLSLRSRRLKQLVTATSYIRRNGRGVYPASNRREYVPPTVGFPRTILDGHDCLLKEYREQRTSCRSTAIPGNR